MAKEYLGPDRPEAELANLRIDWEISPKDIEAMTHEQLVQEVIRMRELIRRLYETAMLQVYAKNTGQPVRPDDINDILNP